ncbi:hypothetical protein G9C98_007418 [Cotesia typhae]|uniref:Uncharacterized protein n=1 Tax=Cotesia typhae TaxID=2053667 RepID=A0A8J5QVG8_9HYME|nr:hypothetical protein G9C98_007418 [Cotesia typhae]
MYNQKCSSGQYPDQCQPQVRRPMFHLQYTRQPVNLFATFQIHLLLMEQDQKSRHKQHLM